MKYSEERRKAVLAKLCPPHNLSVREVAAKEGISEATLYNWRKQALERGELYPTAGSEAQGWSARDKFAAVIETAAMNESERSKYCHKRGLYRDNWPPGAGPANSKRSFHDVVDSLHITKQDALLTVNPFFTESRPAPSYFPPTNFPDEPKLEVI